MIKSAKQNCLWILTSVLLVCLIDGALLFFVDPYHFFHETLWNRNRWSGNPELINEGQIRSLLKKTNDYDTVIIGSSHMMNLKNKAIAKAVHGKAAIKLCAHGMRWSEENMLLKKALATHKIKQVVLCIDWLAHGVPRLSGNLFKNMWFSSILWVWNKNFYKVQENINQIYNFKCNANFANSSQFQQLRKDYQPTSYPSILPYNQDFADLDAYLIHAIKSNPQVQFFLLIHSENFVSNTQKRLFHRIFNNQRYFIEQCASLPNAKIYGFQNHPFVKNLANYYDKNHFCDEIHKFVTYCIEHDWYRITLENFSAYEKDMFENANSFQIEESYPHRDTAEELIAAEWKKREKDKTVQ